jgi:hypothetical protein
VPIAATEVGRRSTAPNQDIGDAVADEDHKAEREPASR